MNIGILRWGWGKHRICGQNVDRCSVNSSPSTTLPTKMAPNFFSFISRASLLISFYHQMWNTFWFRWHKRLVFCHHASRFRTLSTAGVSFNGLLQVQQPPRSLTAPVMLIVVRWVEPVRTSKVLLYSGHVLKYFNHKWFKGYLSLRTIVGPSVIGRGGGRWRWLTIGS